MPHRPVQRVLRESGSPGFVEPLLERTALIGPAVVIVAGGHDRAYASEVRGMGNGGEHLRGANVGPAPHPDLAIRKGESRGPLYRVVAIVRFVLERVPFALRRVAAPDILNDGHIALRGSQFAEFGAAILVVRRPLQQRRELAIRFWTIDVGAKRHTVSHLGGYVPLYRDLVGWRALRGEGEGERQ